MCIERDWQYIEKQVLKRGLFGFNYILPFLTALSEDHSRSNASLLGEGENQTTKVYWNRQEAGRTHSLSRQAHGLCHHPDTEVCFGFEKVLVIV